MGNKDRMARLDFATKHLKSPPSCGAIFWKQDDPVPTWWKGKIMEMEWLIIHIQWPNQSPDHSQTEYAFHLQRTKLKTARPTNKQQLKVAIVKGLVNHIKEETHNLGLSMGRHWCMSTSFPMSTDRYATWSTFEWWYITTIWNHSEIIWRWLGKHLMYGSANNTNLPTSIIIGHPHRSSDTRLSCLLSVHALIDWKCLIWWQLKTKSIFQLSS